MKFISFIFKNKIHKINKLDKQIFNQEKTGEDGI